MPNVPTTKVAFAQGYDLGENGWKTGYDENWQKLDRILPSDFGLQTVSGLVVTLLGGVLSAVAATTATGTTITVGTSATTFIQRDTAGVISTHTASFSAALIPLYRLASNVTAVTAILDVRLPTGGSGGGGGGLTYVGSTAPANRLAYFTSTSSMADLELVFGPTAGPSGTPAISPVTDAQWHLGLSGKQFVRVWSKEVRYSHASNPLTVINESTAGVDVGVNGGITASFRLDDLGLGGGKIIVGAGGFEFGVGGLRLTAPDGSTMEIYSGTRGKTLFQFMDTSSTSATVRFGPTAQAADYTVTLAGPDGSGANDPAAPMVFRAPRGTGNAATGGYFEFQSGVPGASGASLHTVEARLRIRPAATGGFALDFLGTNGAAAATAILTNAPTNNTVQYIPCQFNNANGWIPFIPQ